MSGAVRPRRSPAVAVLAVVALVLAACGEPVLANPPLDYPSAPVASSRPPAPADPIPVVLPRDDGPHDRLTEWWYYTGHLAAGDGRRFGFQAVIFRAERGSAPPAWASHLALTDEQGGNFYYAQRSEVGPQVDHSPSDPTGTPTGFDLQVSGLNPVLVDAGGDAFASMPWRLSGSAGRDRIDAALTANEAALARAPFELHLDLAADKPPALHDDDGFIDFRSAGSSYYYSRTRMSASGVVGLQGESMSVSGIAWFDHQWGDFISIGGGWNWFAVNLDDGTDITISQVLDRQDKEVLVYGTLIDPDGNVRHLYDPEIQRTTLSRWTSTRTLRSYPIDWAFTVGDRSFTVVASIADQELDTRPTTGVVYWEGSAQVLDGETQNRIGRAYTEITRYDQ